MRRLGHNGRRPEEPLTDADVIRASYRDPEAFADVFDRHFDAVHAYAQRRAGREAADELAAEVFTRAFDRRRTFDLRRADARPWLLGITANLLRDHWRAERRRLELHTRALVEERAGADPRDALAADVVAALADLSQGEREAILLLAWADLSYEDIAVALDVPLGTVRSRLSRARRRLRERLGLPEMDAYDFVHHPVKEAPDA